MDDSPSATDPDVGADGATPPDDFVTISRAELAGLRARAEAAGGEPDPPAPDRAAQEREARMARDLAARDLRVAELERSGKAAARDRELATALAGRPLVAGAAAQLVKLWGEDFDAYEEGGVYKVSAADGRAVSQVVDDRLASPGYAHFCLPASRGGAGARDANRPAVSPAEAAPRNLGEAAVMRWRDESAARPNNLLRPIGLRRRR